MTPREYENLNDFEFFVLTQLQYKDVKWRKGQFRTYSEVPLKEVMLATNLKFYRDKYNGLKTNLKLDRLIKKAKIVEDALKGKI